MPHAHGQRRVRPGLGRQPLVGELGVVCVVGADGDDLGALVAGLRHPVGVGGARDRHVRAPHHQVGRIPPVPRLGHVGLVAEDLRAGHRQVGVPVVEACHNAAHQLDEAGADAVADHRHGRDRRESRDPVRAVLLDGVHVRCRCDFHGLCPAGAYQPSLAAGLLVAGPGFRVGGDLVKGEHRVPQPGLGFPVHFQQHAAGVGVAHARWRIGVPGEGGAARAAAGFVLGPVGSHRRVVRLLGFPGDDAVLDVDLPGTGARAVHAVGGAHDLVVAPAVPVEDVASAAPFPEHRTLVPGGLPACEKPPHAQERIGGRGINARCGFACGHGCTLTRVQRRWLG